MSALLLLLALLRGQVTAYDSFDPTHAERHVGVVVGDESHTYCGFELAPYFGPFCDGPGNG